ncbi:MAG: TlpA family protein disulfide reductase, partial [Candidatus Binatia bacterium]
MLLVIAIFEIAHLTFRVRDLKEQLRNYDSAGVRDVVEGEILLPLRGRSLDGRPFVVNPGEPLLILFMSPRCGACRMIEPAWRALSRRIPTEQILVLVSHDVGLNEIIKHKTSSSLSKLRFVRVAQGDSARLRLGAVPRTIVVDSSGKATAVWRGSGVDEELMLSEWQKVSSPSS